MIFQLTDYDTQEELGFIQVINYDGLSLLDAKDEIEESWTDFHKLKEIESYLDNCNVNDFVIWHNKNWVTQIERVFIEVL
jgi:hypothetical protein